MIANSSKKLTVCFCAAALFALIVLAILFSVQFTPIRSIAYDATHEFAVPAMQAVNAETCSASLVLPQEFEQGRSILFKTTHTAVDVLVDGQSVHVHGLDDRAPFIKSPGTLWHIVDVPEGSGGATLTIEITAVYDDFFGNALDISYGSRSACVLHLLTGMLPVVFINAIIIFVGVVCLVFYAVARWRRSRRDFDTFLLVGLFSLTIAVWSLCQCGFLQFLFPDTATLYLIDFYSFFLFPVPFNLFLATICGRKYGRGFSALALAYLINMATATLLQFTGIIDIFQILSVTHAIMAVNVLYVFFSVHKEIVCEHNEQVKRFRLPMDVVVLFAAAELVSYYANGFRKTSIYLPLGTITFIVMLVWIEVAQYYQTILEEQKMAYFKKLANTDMLTEVFNRNAYENTLKRLEQQELEIKTLCVALFDINNMKQINDDFGHEHGDAALKCCCRCIQKAFGSKGSCYRIGGDEFVYLCNDMAQIHHGAQRFDSIVREASKDFPFTLSVAMGFASYDPTMDRTLHDVVRRSDVQMYQRKNVMKQTISGKMLPNN